MLTEQEMRSKMVTIVSLTTDQLTDDELAVLNNFAQLWGTIPKDHALYPKVKVLLSNGLFHEEIKLAIAHAVSQRPEIMKYAR